MQARCCSRQKDGFENRLKSIFRYVFENRESSSDIEITNSNLVDDVYATLDLPNMVEYVLKKFETYFKPVLII